MDSSSLASLVEMLLVYGVVLGLAIWQLISVRRELARDRAAAEKEKSDEKPIA
jgi:hypothetical protein